MTKLERLHRYLRANELDGIIISKPVNRRYFSGFTGSAGVLVVTLSVSDLITDFRYVEQAAAEAQGFRVVQHGSDLLETLAEAVKASGAKRVGFESDYVTYGTYGKIAELLPDAELVALKIDSLRAIKDEAELRLIKKAVDIADAAFTHILSFIKPGVKERDVALELEFFMRKHGAEKSAFDIIVASGARGALPHGIGSEKMIQNGELLTLDFGAVYQGYHSDITRTVAIGKASPEHRKLYNLVLAAQQAGIDAVKSGQSCRAADSAARDVIDDAGYGEYFGHGLGHGVGLAIHEGPRLSPLCVDEILEENMVVTVEPGVYLPGWGGIRIEDIVVVTAAGNNVLTASTKELIELD